MQKWVKKNFQFLLSLLLLLTCWLPVVCQDKSGDFIFTTRHFTPNDGLASREVFCAIQDNDGFMWFGTRNGLNRYDGKNFKLFTKQKNGLAENKIIQLAKDNNNHLFIIYGAPGYARSAMRIEVMDLRTYQLKSLKEIFPNLPFDQEYVYWIANGGEDLCFLVASPCRYWRLTAKGFKLMCEMKSWDLLVPDYGKEIWLTSTSRYQMLWGPYSQFYNDCALLKTGTDRQYFSTPTSTTSFPYVDGGLITHEKKLLFCWDDVNGKMVAARHNGTNPNTIKADSPGGLIAFHSGDFPNALVYREADGLFLYDFTSLHKLLSPGELNISTASGLYSYYVDSQNNFWICTAGGLIKIKQEENRFSHYFTKEQLRDSSENQARGIYADERGTVYAGIWNKLFYNSNGQTKSSQIGPDNIIYGLCRVMNKLYVGEANIFELGPDKTGGLKNLTHGDLMEVWTLDSLAPNTLLAGCTEAIYTFDLTADSLKTPAYRSASIPNVQFVYRFIRRKDRAIWAAAQNGLYLLNETADSLVGYFGKGSKEASHRLPFDVLHDAYEDGNGIFWLATNGEGLYRWNRNKKTRRQDEPEFTQFNTADGLPSDILYRIESDDYGNLWISTDNGLARFNIGNFKTRTYTTGNGISHNEFNRASSFKAKDGRLFFGGLNGITAFYPKDFQSDSSQLNTPLHIVSLNQFVGSDNKLLDKTGDLIQKNRITLRPGDKFFTLEFQLLDFEEASHQYAYMIDGIDKDWNYIAENSIRFSGLPNGNHTLRIKGQNTKGAWSKKELSIPVSVLRPFSKTVPFYLILAALLGTAIYLFMHWRTRSLKEANARLEETVNKRTVQLLDSLNQKDVLLKEIHHRVKNNLQIISSMLELQAANAENDLLKKGLIEGQNRVQSIALIHHRLYENENLGEIEFGGFLKDLYKQVVGVFHQEGQQVEAYYNVPEINFDIDTIVPLGLLVNELLTNSFKYAFRNNAAGKITMSVSKQEEGYFIFTYKDSGPGLRENFEIQKASSLGLRLIYRLGKQLGGSVSYDKNGNTFYINFKDSITRKQHE